MYIEPLALFILLEVFIAVIVVSGFLFYKSRLLRVMIAILTHLRKERARREMERRAELAKLRQENKALAADVVKIREDSGNSYLQQIQSRLKEVDAETSRRMKDASEEEGEDISHQAQLRKIFLEYEALMSAPGANREKATEEFIQQLEKAVGARANLIPVDSELGQLQEQIELHKKRIALLEPFEAQVNSLQAELDEAERKIEELRTITENDFGPGYQSSEPGEHTDEIHRLKSERFDLMESVNELRLKLQKAIADGNTQDIVDLMELQISQQAQYMKESDTAITLLEKELETANKMVSDLRFKLENMPAPSGVDFETAEAVETLNTESVEKLNDYANDQKNSIAAMRDNLVAFRAAKEESEREELLERQNSQIQTMEASLKESETCVMILENELRDANEKIGKLHKVAKKAKNNKEVNKQANEMENLLRKFVTDSEDMVACIGGLENENLELRAKLVDMGVGESELPKHVLPPDAMKIKKHPPVPQEKDED